jgi:endonuclease/exonuclease/phosphatase family metal-dependent hydrolase
MDAPIPEGSRTGIGDNGACCRTSKAMKHKDSRSWRLKVSLATPVKFRQALRIAVCVLTTVGGVVTTTLAEPADSRGTSGKRHFSSMSYNLYVGAMIEEVLAAESAEELVALVTEVYYEVQASNPGARMEAVADEIAARMPDAVALQEVSVLLVQTPGDWLMGGETPAEDPVVDFLDLLLDALQSRGCHYQVAVVVEESDVELPMLNPVEGFDDVRLIDREVILVRADLPPGQLRIHNPQSGHFDMIIEVPELGIAVERGWCSVDVSLRGREFRYVCTHPEPSDTFPELNYVQVAQLLDELSTESLPVILTGDFNTDPQQRDGSFSYALFNGAGFVDAWDAVHPDDPAGGLTYGHDYYLADPTFPFDWRLDLLLYRGSQFTPKTFEVIDSNLAVSIPPLWPSDHAGIYGEFLIR